LSLWLFSAGLLWGLTVVAPQESFANGFRILDQSASAVGQSSAFTAQADDPSALYYNPAGMTQLNGVQFSVGALMVGGSTSFTSPTGSNAKGDFNGSVAYPPPSNFYVTARLKDIGITALGDTTVGLAVISPFGISYRYPDDGPFSTAVTRAALPLIDIKPTVAYRLNEYLSFGVGADIYTFASFLGEGQADIKFNWPGGGGIPAGTPMEVNGNDTAGGFNVSMMYTPLHVTVGTGENAVTKPRANIGLVYRSQATLHLKGQFMAAGAVVSDASTTLVLPQVFTGAIALWPVRDEAREWKLEMDVDYTDWSSFRNTDVHLSNGSTLPFPRNWKGSYTTMIGTEYKWLNPAFMPNWEVALRGGYWHSQNAVPDSTFNPAVPDADQDSVSIGLGLLCKGQGKFLGLIGCGGSGGGIFSPQAFGIDFAYQALFYENRTVSGNLNPTVNGTYQTTYHVGSVNLRVNF
jgi:long-chain fatty acid transport protein